MNAPGKAQAYTCPCYRFGDFGGRFAPELQMDALQSLTVSFEKTRLDGAFCEGLPFNSTVRPSPLQLAKNLTLLAGGAFIWLKREDLCEYGSENTLSILGQILFARRIGKTEIVTECGSASHGIVCAKTCERLKLSCTIFMAESDANSQARAIQLMRIFGASVVLVQANNGLGTLRSALNEAIRYSVCRIDSAYHVMCGPIGPHPLPTITRHFQSILGEETKAQFAERNGGHLPDAIVSPVGTGSGAVGMFYPFIQCETVQLVGVEAMEAAPLSRGSVGVLYGCKTYVLQNTDGQILPSRSAAPDMALPVAGPELAHWRSTKRVTFVAESDSDAFEGIELLGKQEGILAGLSTGYAISKSMSLARELGAGKHIVLLIRLANG
ncbi:tryptophan synthase beta subunit-like PLP-dependent enzyme [Aspergillus navahoensis]